MLILSLDPSPCSILFGLYDISSDQETPLFQRLVSVHRSDDMQKHSGVEGALSVNEAVRYACCLAAARGRVDAVGCRFHGHSPKTEVGLDSYAYDRSNESRVVEGNLETAASIEVMEAAAGWLPGVPVAAVFDADLPIMGSITSDVCARIAREVFVSSGAHFEAVPR
jgi:hypothetical protein